MDNLKKVQIIADASTILLLHVATYKKLSIIALGLQELLSALGPEEVLRSNNELQILFQAIKDAQKQLQKTGTAQNMFIEDLKDKFELGSGKPKNVCKGRVRKKD